jgi:hypothetical protein
MHDAGNWGGTCFSISSLNQKLWLNSKAVSWQLKSYPSAVLDDRREVIKIDISMKEVLPLLWPGHRVIDGAIIHTVAINTMVFVFGSLLHTWVSESR